MVPPRILFLEDEILISLETTARLEDMGYTDVKAVYSLQAAEELFREGGVDLAVLDLNIAEESTLPLAREMLESGMPIVFTSGYHVDPAQFEGRNVQIVRKPYFEDQLRTAIEDALAKR